MEEIHIHKKNEVYLKVECDRGIAMELSGYFEFEVPGASFMPSVRNKMWDGKIRLFNVNTMQIYVGLIQKIKKFAEDTKLYASVNTSDQAYKMKQSLHNRLQ